jgi:hypothetical protein
LAKSQVKGKEVLDVEDSVVLEEVVDLEESVFFY